MCKRASWGRRRENLPRGMVELARRRSSFALEAAWCYPNTPLQDLLASVYLQGIEDALQVIDAQMER